MSVVRADLLCECEGCQKRFGIEVDLATDLPDYPDFEQVAREVIRNGGCGYTWGVRGLKTVERFPLKTNPTIQGGLMLCDECTLKCDALPIDSFPIKRRSLTHEEVRNALDLIQDDDE